MKTLAIITLTLTSLTFSVVAQTGAKTTTGTKQTTAKPTPNTTKTTPQKNTKPVIISNDKKIDVEKLKAAQKAKPEDKNKPAKDKEAQRLKAEEKSNGNAFSGKGNGGAKNLKEPEKKNAPATKPAKAQPTPAKQPAKQPSTVAPKGNSGK